MDADLPTGNVGRQHGQWYCARTGLHGAGVGPLAHSGRCDLCGWLPYRSKMYFSGHYFSRIRLIRCRSFLFVRLMAEAIKGANNLEKPVGTPLFRSVIRVVSGPVAAQV